jgi:phosphate transport system protein
MRSVFNRQLALLAHCVAAMGMQVEAALGRRAAAAGQAAGDAERGIESLCLKLLLMQQPVASDLRLVSAALKMVADLARIGANAANIGGMAADLACRPPLEPLGSILEMAGIAARMVGAGLDAFAAQDEHLARSVASWDDEIDLLYAKVRHKLIELVHEDMENGEAAFELLQVAKYYERIGDHAENAARWVVFSITGEHGSRLSP